MSGAGRGYTPDEPEPGLQFETHAGSHGQGWAPRVDAGTAGKSVQPAILVLRCAAGAWQGLFGMYMRRRTEFQCARGWGQGDSKVVLRQGCLGCHRPLSPQNGSHIWLLTLELPGAFGTVNHRPDPLRPLGLSVPLTASSSVPAVLLPLGHSSSRPWGLAAS